MRTPTLAAISVDHASGGIGVVARLLWSVFERQWAGDAHMLLLLEGAPVQPTLADKARFAVRAARLQITGRSDWMLFAHLGLATVQQGLPRRLRSPYGVFLYGTEIWRPLSAGQRRVLTEADLRIAISPFTASRVMDMHPDIGPVDICPLALPPPESGERLAGGETMVPRLGRHVVLMVGRMLAAERYKGHDELIDAWPQILAAVPDAQLVIVGQGDDMPRLQAKAAASGTGRSILFLGYVPQAVRDKLYDAAALFALPSRGEGFGLVYLEAMARRRACLGSIHDAARDVIVDRRTGRLIDQDDVRQMAAAVIDLLHDEQGRQAMGEAGYQRLHQHFTLEQFSSRVTTLLTGATEARLTA